MLVRRIALVALVGTLAADLILIGVYSHGPQPDVAEFHTYALDFWQHRLLPREYPPLSIVPMLLTLAPPISAFEPVFGAWMAAIVMAGYFLLRGVGASRAGLIYLTYLLAGAAGTVLARFDIVPALTVLGAYLFLQRGRYRACYVLLALGTLVKLFPLFLVPLVAIDHFRSNEVRGKRTAASAVATGFGIFAGTVVAGFGLAAILDPTHAFGSFSYAFSRPPEVESGPATLLWLGGLAGWPAHGAYSFESFNLIGPADRLLEPLAVVTLIAGWGYVCARLSMGRVAAGEAWIACLGIVLLTNKVLSAQYLIWILPLVALVEGIDTAWLVVALLTSLIFPVLLAIDVVQLPGGKLEFGWPILAFIAVRNALLLAVTLRALHSRTADHRGQAAQELLLGSG